MICKIHGLLEAIEDNTAMIRTPGALTYEVMVSAYTAARLGGSIDQEITLFTLHYLEGQNQGATMYPRLAGFLDPADREFFELFTTTKGIGNKRALRAMTMATGQIAMAIADRDLSTLQTLPEVGRRTAETIVAALHGKVDRFVGAASGAGDAKAAGIPGAPMPTSAVSREAVEALVQLGEVRQQALNWVDQVMRLAGEKDRPKDASDLIARVYRIKAGG
ncbi:MAG: helix-hairpin-helix domain-containing protein [Planctomycetota bacterium]|nr:helix-hairpin-helix domain-containing protein [Planctomycetota bacterium]